ncbi:hypothetical protein [Anaerotignum sp.]|uniref:hypothetical protein n=1 Tax=Anaerotignum sp. TaxID=2039241 RepID=UPI002F41733B
MSIRKFIPTTIMIPAIAIGAFTMYQHHVPMGICIQNIACLVFMSLISMILFTGKISIFESSHRKFLLPICLFLLVVTLVSQGMEGVHRWISIGFIRLNIAMIVIPIIFIELWYVLKTKGVNFAWVIAFLVILLLYFQPDASQLTGFALPLVVMLCLSVNGKVIRFFMISIFSMFIVLSWVFLDTLPPVAYVEGILKMAADVGLPWLISGILSLVALPIPFLLFPPKNEEILSKCIGFYFAIVIISAFFGNFPVPLVGYGISPIVGYFISFMWYLNSKYV